MQQGSKEKHAKNFDFLLECEAGVIIFEAQLGIFLKKKIDCCLSCFSFQGTSRAENGMATLLNCGILSSSLYSLKETIGVYFLI